MKFYSYDYVLMPNQSTGLGHDYCVDALSDCDWILCI